MGFGVPATIIMILAVVFLIRTYLKSQVKLKFNLKASGMNRAAALAAWIIITNDKWIIISIWY